MIKLHSSQPPLETNKRITRVRLSVKLLRTLTTAEVRAVYADLEEVRDMLSQILDRADGKFR